MHLVLTGATGLVGSGVLHYMITAPSITKVSVLSRRPVAQAEGHEKVKVIIHKDFTTYPSEVMDQLKDVDGVVWAQGISQTKVTREEYFPITHTYPLNFAQAIAKTTSPKPVNFIYVSGEGATTTPSALTMHFGVVKGKAEADLLALSKNPEFANLQPYSVRPNIVLATDHKEIQEYLPPGPWGFKYMKWMLPALTSLAPSFTSPTRELGMVLSKLATGEFGGGKPFEEGKGVSGEGRTVNNVVLRNLAGI